MDVAMVMWVVAKALLRWLLEVLLWCCGWLLRPCYGVVGGC